jgi:hypothetical protein
MNIGEVLAPILARIPRERQPLLIAAAERLAAERYRGWAAQVVSAGAQAGLRACADREEEIARRIEGLYPDAGTVQQEILDANPDLLDVNRTLFAGRPLREQFRLQADGERLGAATWRSFARNAASGAARDALLACALLEEESASFLESILAAA